MTAPTNLFKALHPAYTEAEEIVCKGIVFRCILNAYIAHDDSYVEKIMMRPLKRKSCKGCVRCGWIIDSMRESVGDERFPIIHDAMPNALYKVIVVNEQEDWETGFIDDFDLEFKRIDE